MYFFSEVQWNSKGMSFRISRPELVNRLCHLIVVWPWASHFAFSALFPSSISDGMCGHRFWWQIRETKPECHKKASAEDQRVIFRTTSAAPLAPVSQQICSPLLPTWLRLFTVLSAGPGHRVCGKPEDLKEAAVTAIFHFQNGFHLSQFLGAASPIPLWSWFNRLAEPGNHWDTWKWVFGIFIFLSGRWALPQMVGARSKWREELQVLGGHKEKDNHSLKVLVTQSCLTLCDPMHQILVSMEFSRQEYWSG